jgi:hypothetical protein
VCREWLNEQIRQHLFGIKDHTKDNQCVKNPSLHLLLSDLKRYKADGGSSVVGTCNREVVKFEFRLWHSSQDQTQVHSFISLFLCQACTRNFITGGSHKSFLRYHETEFLCHCRIWQVKWSRYQAGISLETQVEITIQRNR